VRALLDTHAFLWFVFDDPRLSQRAADLIEDQDVVKLLSVASLWEVAVKTQLGKLALGLDLETFFRRHVEERLVDLVGVQLPHLVAYGNLPLHHRDPFDRLLISQAEVLDVPIVTADARFAPYGVETVW
jgi:PIN domain nuclease of toxin-antitoxin system